MPEQTTPPPLPPNTTGKPPDEGFAFHSFLEQPPLWKQLWQGLKDLVNPPKQPELKLESKPIPVKDIWSKDEKSLASKVSSVVIHVLVMGLIILVVALKPVRQKIAEVATPIFVPTQPPPPPPDIKVLKLAKGGGPVVQAPKIIPVQRVPQALAAPTAIVPLAQATSALPFFGNSSVAGGPPGPGGNGGPDGSGVGAVGNCDPSKESDCVIGVGIAAPEAIYSPDPEYSDEARKAKFQGTVDVRITIGTDGRVLSAEVVQPLGLGLDEKATEAVKTWKFIPAKYQGRPIQITAIVEVNFHLY